MLHPLDFHHLSIFILHPVEMVPSIALILYLTRILGTRIGRTYDRLTGAVPSPLSAVVVTVVASAIATAPWGPSVTRLEAAATLLAVFRVRSAQTVVRRNPDAGHRDDHRSFHLLSTSP